MKELVGYNNKRGWAISFHPRKLIVLEAAIIICDYVSINRPSPELSLPCCPSLARPESQVAESGGNLDTTTSLHWRVHFKSDSDEFHGTIQGSEREHMQWIRSFCLL